MKLSFSDPASHLRRLHPPVFLALAVVFWLWPFFQAGWKGRAHRFLPNAVKFQYNAAGLFTKRVMIWWDHHLEVELRDGTRIELSERAVFPMGAFGYRTRFDRILNESNRSRYASEIQNRIASHVATKIRSGEAKVDAGKVIKILLVRSKWRVGSPEMARPSGHWNPPPSPTLRDNQREILGIWAFNKNSLIPVIALPRQQIPPERASRPRPQDFPRRRLVIPE